jgi:D-serine deaminase-like pyridoxal phosphate-dependent protein
MKRLLYLSLAVLATACGTTRSLQNSESSRVEVRMETVFKHDTAYVELPVFIEKVATLDTASTLENTYAKSEAIVTAGILHHSLETKPVKVPVQVETKTEYRDSIIYRDCVITETQEVEKKLTWWQELKMKAGALFLIITLIGITYFIITHFINLNKFSL